MKTGTFYFLHQVLNDDSLDNATDALLMIAIANHVNGEDKSVVGIETLCQYARCGYSTAKRRLSSLEERGYLERSRLRRGDGNMGVYEWRIVRGPELDLSHDQSSPRRAMTRAHPGEPADQPTIINTKKPDPRSGPFWDEFQQVWEVYPRRTAKLKSFEAFQARRRCGVSFQDLFDATKRYRDEVAGTEERFIKHGSTFFGPGEFWREQLESGSVVRDKLNGWVER